MLTGGVAGMATRFVRAADLGRHRQAVMMTLAMWTAKAVAQNNAAATAGAVMG
jgi:hypothetical protein